jgi:5'-phosphate synthase pdxT subunit
MGHIKKVGVLALQGDFAEHIEILKNLGVEAVEVRRPEQLDDLDGLIIPGGESTTIGSSAWDYQLLEPLRKFGQEKPIWGLVRARFSFPRMPALAATLGLMDITVERNALVAR